MIVKENLSDKLVKHYSDGGFLMHGLNYTLSIPIILLLSFASLSLSVLSYLRERDERVE